MKDPLLADYTPEELMIEYLMDVVEEDPSEEFPRGVREAGLYGHRTGDALLDRWQADAALGKAVDFDEAFDDPDQLRQFEAIKAASKRRFRERAGTLVDGGP
jgi:hypothetical protein